MQCVRLITAIAGLLFCALVLSDGAGFREVPLRRIDVDLSYCLQVSRGQAQIDTYKCPALMADLREADASCSEQNGKLIPTPQSALFALDIDADGRDEYLFEFNQNFQCTGAASLFSCGISDCPWILYRQLPSTKGLDVWQSLGAFPVDAQFFAMAREVDKSHPDLRVRCTDEFVCNPAMYHWNGAQYEEKERWLRGFPVKLLQEAKLLTLRRKTIVFAEPRPESSALGEYGVDAIFVVFGEASNTDYLSVSPCSACESGFVQRRDLDF